MIALQDSCDFGFVFAGGDDFFEVGVGFEVEHFCAPMTSLAKITIIVFLDRGRLVGSELPGEHNEVVGKHGAMHVGFEVIESLPVAA